MIEVRSATTPDGFRQFSAEWDSALRRHRERRVFLCSEWIDLWWRADPELRSARMIMATGPDGAQALAPLRTERLGRGPFGVPVAASFGNAVSNRSDIVLLDESGVCARELLDRIFGSAPLPRRLGRTPVSSPVRLLQDQGEERGWVFRATRRYELPVVDVTTPCGAFFAGRSSNFRKSRSRMLRRHEAMERRVVDFEREDPDAVLDQVLQVSARTWKAEAGTAIVNSPAHASFFRTLLRNRGAIRPFATLTLASAPEGRRPLGFLIGAIWERRLYALKTGYDPDRAAADLGFGLLDATISYACASPDIDLVDLDVLGPHGDYKRRWMTGSESLVSGYLFGPGFADRALLALFEGARRLRFRESAALRPANSIVPPDAGEA